MNSRVGIIGSGPAALMAASVVSKAGFLVSVFEKRGQLGRKLLIAGSSGLNITNSLPLEDFATAYRGQSQMYWLKLLKEFSPQDWIHFIEELGFKTFLGTSRRYFLEEMKAALFLKDWAEQLKNQGVEFYLNHEFSGFETKKDSSKINIDFFQKPSKQFDAVCFALGGGSWEESASPVTWISAFEKNGLVFREFMASNVGYRVQWHELFLKEADRLPLKRVVLKTKLGQCAGDLMITSYGLEGTPVYTLGVKGPSTLDLMPDLSEAKILELLVSVKENWSPFRRIQKKLNLCPAAEALVFHLTPQDILKDSHLKPLVHRLKNFPIELLEPQPLSEAISSSGGLCFSELNEHQMIQKFPGFFAAGEMLDWDAPTGGFLIQACVSQGFRAGTGIINYLNHSSRS